MQRDLITLNAGSSSLKLAVYEINAAALSAEPIVKAQVENLREAPFAVIQCEDKRLEERLPTVEETDQSAQAAALAYLLNWLQQNLSGHILVAAGHRVVHGADQFTQATVLNAAIIAQLAALNKLAPLHQPHNIAGMQALAARIPTIFQVACFDTAFHATQAPLAQVYALPDGITVPPLKRYGFHGISYEYIAQVLPHYLKEQANEKVIVAHLGHGASLCGMEKGQSVSTSMGFSVLEGLPMGTRCGNLDPGVLLYLLEQENKTVAEVTELLYRHSGLLGVSGISADVRTLLASENPKAQFAIELFVYQIAREISATATALGGLQHIIFTAGIGEHVAVIREKVCALLAWLGVKLNKTANMEQRTKISAEASSIAVWIIPTNEEWMIAQHTWRLYQQQGL